MHAPFTSQEVVLRKALKLGDGVAVSTPPAARSPPTRSWPPGLIRIGEAAARIHRGESDRALAHATSGPCLQQNLVAVLEGDAR